MKRVSCEPCVWGWVQALGSNPASTSKISTGTYWNIHSPPLERMKAVKAKKMAGSYST
jgi:hypothetical protein